MSKPEKHSSPRGEWSSTPPEHTEHLDTLEAAAEAGQLDSQPEVGEELEQTLLARQSSEDAEEGDE